MSAAQTNGVVVGGAGSAACVAPVRLSKDADVTVAGFEAGPPAAS